ncbi:MAG: hypothetical protein NTW28_17390 [Candidatus Solibacter sp.]|nr:hypothetical protein [Candidatus Solibacter sp.]
MGLAILVAVYAAGGYRAVGVAVSIGEAREIAASHWRHYTGAAIEKYWMARGMRSCWIAANSPSTLNDQWCGPGPPNRRDL